MSAPADRDDPERVVLVAEDSLVVRALLRAQLVERGYTVVEAADGEQALQRAREAQPDVILLDVEMPRMDGFAVLETLNADPTLADAPVVFITGRTTAGDAIRGLDLGAHDYLRKPFEPAELAARVHAAYRTKRLRDDLRAANAELRRLAATDTLTGLPNRRLLEEELTRLVSGSARHGRPLSALVIDVDRFKAVNDRFGHAAGDQVLTAIGERLGRRLREEDVLGRWGGEEYLILAPDTDAAGAAVLGEALRRAVADTPIDVGGTPYAATISVGWACSRGESAAELLRRADAAMYRAKEAGRDRVVGD